MAVAAGRCGEGPLLGILGVTVLTSVAADSLPDLGVAGTVEELVLRRAAFAKAAGCMGLVCSPHEVASLRRVYGREMRLVVPGVRPVWAQVGGDDQARVATPSGAVSAGADYVVIGRPIRDAKNPVDAARRVVFEMAQSEPSP